MVGSPSTHAPMREMRQRLQLQSLIYYSSTEMQETKQNYETKGKIQVHKRNLSH